MPVRFLKDNAKNFTLPAAGSEWGCSWQCSQEQSQEADECPATLLRPQQPEHKLVPGHEIGVIQ
jgi:hypothetical protein